MAQYQFEFKDESADDFKWDTSEPTPDLKARLGTLAQMCVEACAESRLQDMPQGETGAVVRELRERGVMVDIYSEDGEDAIIEFSD
jgi:hypothetical protein